MPSQQYFWGGIATETWVISSMVLKPAMEQLLSTHSECVQLPPMSRWRGLMMAILRIFTVKRLSNFIGRMALTCLENMPPSQLADILLKRASSIWIPPCERDVFLLANVSKIGSKNSVYITVTKKTEKS